MTGIAGAVGPGLGDTTELARRMVITLRYSEATVEAWSQPEALLCRVHHTGETPGRDTSVHAKGARRIIFWGDIYETHAIREDLLERGHRIRQEDAGELVLALYEEHGSSGFSRLDGSFAFAIHDSTTGELLLGNDRFSSRPVYWARSRTGATVFGTQVQTVLQAPGLSRDLDAQSVIDLFHYQRVHGLRTLTRGVSLLAPGTVLRAGDGRVSLEPWFEMRYSPETRSEGEWAEAMAEVFHRSINRSISDAGRTALLLSGGLDSRIVLAAAARELDCFHFNDHRNEEFHVANQIAAAANQKLTYVERSENHYADIFETAVRIGSGQYCFVNAHPIGLLPNDGLDVVIHGFAPELFFRGKNLPHRRHSIFGKHLHTSVDSALSAENIATKMVTKLNYNQHRQQPSRFFREAWNQDFNNHVLSSAEDLVSEARLHSDDPYDWFIWPDTRYHCKYPSFLFEAALRPFHNERSVVFHNDVLDLHLRMPVAARANSRVWKLAVKQLNPKVARVPDANTGHSPFLPWPVALAMDLPRRFARGLGLRGNSRVIGRTSGSWPNFPELITHNRHIRSIIEQSFRDPEALDPSIFDIPRIQLEYQNHLAGRANHDMSLFLLATFGCWHRNYGPPGHALR